MWMVQGCLDWQRDGLQEPPEVLAATQEYRIESDTFRQWFSECCNLDSSGDCKASPAYQNYRKWCESSKTEHPLSQTKFGTRLTEQDFTKYKNRDGWIYRGFTLNDQGCD